MTNRFARAFRAAPPRTVSRRAVPLLAGLAAPLALAGCTLFHDPLDEPIYPPPINYNYNEATGALPTSELANRLQALELDVAALKIELSRIASAPGGAPAAAPAAIAPIAKPAAEASTAVPADSAPARLASAPSEDQAQGPASEIAAEKNDVPKPVDVARANDADDQTGDPDTASQARAESGEPQLAALLPSSEPAVGDPAAGAENAADSAYAVQLAAYGNEAQVQVGWERIRTSAATLFDGLSPRRSTADVPGRGTLYRLKAGPFADEAGATAKCDALKTAGISCLVSTFDGVWP